MAGPGNFRGFLLVSTLLLSGGAEIRAQLHNDFPKIGQRNINKGRFGFPNIYSPDQESVRGAALDQRLRSELRPANNPGVSAYLQNLLAQLGEHSDYRGPLTAYLTRGQDSLIFTTMGGYLYIDEHLLRTAANESELAGALAHEIGHLAARHGSENRTRQELIRANPSWLARLFRAGMLATRYITRTGVDGFWSAVGYSNEIEADELGTQYLWFSGFDPEALLNLLKRLNDQNVMDHPRGLFHFTYHPPISLRRQRIVEVLKDLPPLESARLDSSAFRQCRKELRTKSIRLEVR